MLIALFCLITMCSCYAQSETDYMNYAPVLSPKGTHLAYYAKKAGNWDIYLMSLAGGHIKRLTDDPSFEGEPAWSPDGSSIVFTSDRDGDDEIFVLSLQTKKITQITHNDLKDVHPGFSPNGKNIIYQTEMDNQRQLMQIEYPNEHAKPKLFSEMPVSGRMRWSTARNSLSFMTEILGKNAVCRLDARGNPLSITFIPFHNAGNPCYSEEQKLIVFDAHSENKTASGDGKWELYTLDITTHKLIQLTDDPFDNWGAVWSRDGNAIFFAGGGLDNKGYEIKRYDIKKKEVQQLTSGD